MIPWPLCVHVNSGLEWCFGAYDAVVEFVRAVRGYMWSCEPASGNDMPCIAVGQGGGVIRAHARPSNRIVAHCKVANL